MALMETARQRLRNAIDFAYCYENLCALQNLCPLSAVTANLDDQTIDCNADRIRQPDWTPIWAALKINKGLKMVAFRSYWQQTLFPDTVELSAQRLIALKKKTPPIRSKDMTYKLCRTLKECLCKSESLSCLTLQGIPLRERDLACLAKGITKNNTLQHLSLEFCQIGDHGVDILSNAIKGSQSITSINFTGCNLTSRGAEEIAKMIRFQATRRHSIAWQDSLRYRRPDMDRMSGLRRITMCKNPLINDNGMEYLAEALKDDLWVKALDLQQCGISTEGAMEFQPVLKFNTTINVLDLRLNPLIDRDMMRALMEQIMLNAGEMETEYPWIVIEEPKPGRIRQLRKGVKRERPRTVSTAYGRKSARNGNQAPRTRSASARSPAVRATSKKTGTGFVPWRTEARIGKNRHKLKPDADESPSHAKSKGKKKKSRVPDFDDPRAASSPVGSEDDTTPSTRSSRSKASSSQSTESDSRRSENDVKEMRIEIEFLRRRVEDESRARASADSRVLELQVENRRLQQEMRLMKAKQTSSPQKTLKAPAPVVNGQTGIKGPGRTLLEDDRFLESIEASFKQFYGFLDLLKGEGYGDLAQALKENGFPLQSQPTTTGNQPTGTAQR